MRWLLALLALPLLIHLPEASGLVSSDPLPLLSGLAGASRPGLLPGYPGWIDGNAGVTTQALGRLVARDWFAGIVPWWNPYSGVGTPLAGEYQPAAFFLPFVLLLGLPNGVLWLKLALQIVAASGAWALGRQLGFRRPVSFMVGLLFAFNGSFAWASDAPIQPMAMLPLILLGVERARDGSWLPLGLGLGWSLLAGFPETAYLDGLLALGWASLRLACDGRDRSGFAWRLGLAGGFALLLAAPQLVAFADFVPYAFLGDHAGIVDSALPPAAFALWLMPVLLGPMFFAGQAMLWYTLGGYLGTASVLLGLVGIGGRRERPLRWLLAGWALLIAGKSAAWPPFAQLADAIPLMGHSIVSRYGTPSMAMALILLAGYAVEDWRRGVLSGRRRAIGLAVWLAMLAACLYAAWPTLRLVASVPGGRTAMLSSLCLTALVTLSLVWLLGGAPRRWRLGAMLATICLEALLLFTLPLLSAAPAARIDDGTIGFLRAHLGLQRFTTLGNVLVPNYGAFWGLASINHNMMPVPAAWNDWLHADFDPAIDPSQFYGADGPDAAGLDRRARAIRTHLDALAGLGVRYVLQAHGPDRLGAPMRPVSPASGSVAAGLAVLAAGAALEADYPGPPQAMRARGLSVPVGTFIGHAGGTLLARLCSDGVCAAGSATLSDAIDDAPLPIELDRPLAVGPGTPLRLTLTHRDGAGVAIWLRRSAGGPALPVLALAPAGQPMLVHAGDGADIDALSDPAPYAELPPPCRLSIISRTEMRADCPMPATLLRRELFLPGWQVRIGRAGWRPVDRDQALFQSVRLPAGRSTLHFAYAPPHAAIGWLGLLAACTMAASAMAPRRAWKRARRGRGEPSR